MIAAILGRKIGMTQVFDESGQRVPVTIIEAGPCVVTQVKTADSKDGYFSVQLGFDDNKPHRSTLPMLGHLKKAKTGPKRFIREIRLNEATDRQLGDTVTVDIFSQNEVKYVDVTGVTRGKGFQGGMKRWGFGGQPASHGTERKHRSPGAISSYGCERGRSGGPKRGKKMAGHTGHTQRTIRNQPLVQVDPDNNILLVRGAIPGPKNGYVLVRTSKTKA